MNPIEKTAHFLLSVLITRPAILVGRLARILTGRSFSTSALQEPVDSILIVLVEHLGDLIIASSFLRDTRTDFPRARITLVVDTRFLSYAKQCPYVDEVLGFDESGSKFLRALIGPYRAFTFAMAKLWSRKFDLAIKPFWGIDLRHGTLIGLYSLARVHLGFSVNCSNSKRIINAGLNGAFSHVLYSDSVIHEGARGADLLTFLGMPSTPPAGEVWLKESDVSFARQSLPIEDSMLIALGIGASQEKRQWPIERFGAAAAALRRKWPEAKFLIVGDSTDAQLAERLRELLGSALLNFAGKCSIGQSAALLSRCRLYVGNDSGPMHMAAAMQVPVVELSCHPPVRTR